MGSTRTFRLWLLLPAALLLSASAAAAVSVDWVTVGDPGNAADTTSFGAVADEYRIAKFEVSNAQYAEFLNAVAATDTHALYNTNMGSGFGGITRSGSSGSYSYSAIAGRENLPVNYVSFWDATRFANWLHNGQPTGAQDNTTTEDGAYTLTPTDIANNTLTRKAGAEVFVPSEDEWYKAAYYQGGGTSAGYWAYPAGSHAQTSCTAPGATANTANCSNVHGVLTDAGSYTGSASPYGTFDQGGNVWEWNEMIPYGSNRGVRGGSFLNLANNLAASFRVGFNPTIESYSVGFRVASPVPASPSVPSLSPFGMTLLLSGLGFAGYRKLRA